LSSSHDSLHLIDRKHFAFSIFRHLLMEEEIGHLQDKLRKLHLEERTILRRLRTLRQTATNTSSPASHTAGNRSGNTTNFQVGDVVQFESTRTTAGGVGHIIHFTAGTSPYAVIQRSGTHSASHSVKRQLHNIRHHVNQQQQQQQQQERLRLHSPQS
jgi:hypothetical protein